MLAATLTDDGTVRLWRNYPDTQPLIDFAKQIAPQCLSPSQRATLIPNSRPPAWCITGAGREQEPDRNKWQPKPPYQGKEWRDWLAASRAGHNPPLPDQPALHP
jgi:hypothetical protein